AGNGEERKADGEETGHQVPQPAQEVAEGQNPVKTGQEEVTPRSSRRAGICPKAPAPDAPDRRPRNCRGRHPPPGSESPRLRGSAAGAELAGGRWRSGCVFKRGKEALRDDLAPLAAAGLALASFPDTLTGHGSEASPTPIAALTTWLSAQTRSGACGRIMTFA